MDVMTFMDTPQQQSDSLDCGVIVCHIIATIFQHHLIKASCDAERTRAGLVHTLLNTPIHSWTKQGYQDFLEARKIHLQMLEKNL